MAMCYPLISGSNRELACSSRNSADTSGRPFRNRDNILDDIPFIDYYYFLVYFFPFQFSFFWIFFLMIFSSLFLYCYYFFHFQFSFFFFIFFFYFQFSIFFLVCFSHFLFFFMYIFSYLFAVPYSKLLILMERSFFGLRLQFDASAFLIWNPLSTRPSEMLEMPLLFKSRGKENIYSFLHHLCLPQ